MVVTFANPVTIGGASVTTGTGTATSSVAGNVVTIDLTGVTNAQRLGVTISSVNDGTNLGSILVPMGVLVGDTNQSGVVNAGDTVQTRARSGQTADGTNFLSDVNIDGTINSGDQIQVRSRSGTALP
jgi:hypothetical protein